MKESEMWCNPIKFSMINYSICASQRLLVPWLISLMVFFFLGGGVPFLLHSLFFNVEALIE